MQENVTDRQMSIPTNRHLSGKSSANPNTYVPKSPG